jgi:hypothetical protein
LLADWVKNIPKPEHDNLVLLSQSALQLCDISIGDPVKVGVDGVYTVKTAWPTLEKSLVSVLLTRRCKLILVANIIKMMVGKPDSRLITDQQFGHKNT